MIKNKVGLLALSSIVCMLLFGSAFAGVKSAELYNSSKGLHRLECTNGVTEHSMYNKGGVWYQGASRMNDKYDNQSFDFVARDICR